MCTHTKKTIYLQCSEKSSRQPPPPQKTPLNGRNFVKKVSYDVHLTSIVLLILGQAFQ